MGSDFNFTLKNNIIDDLYEYAVKRNTAGYGPASSYCGNLLYTHAANYSAVHAITYLGVIFRLKTPSGYLETDMSKTTIACIPASSA